jgi:hypothetical protein
LSKPTVVILGILGRTPFAGIAWQVMHFVEGFRRAGFDTYYVEDTGTWPYDRERNVVTDDCSFIVGYIAQIMERCGMEDRWAYQAASKNNRVYGLSAGDLRQLYGRAAALVNLTGATILRDEHLGVPIRIYLETDPVLPQIEIDQGREFTIDLLRAHTHHFTYGELIGTAACEIPAVDFQYHPTRQPVVVDWWSDANGVPDAQQPFTTVAAWRQTGKDIQWQGHTYTWSKHHEFLKVLDLPRRSGSSFELALSAIDDDERDLLESSGWSVADALSLSSDLSTYRQFICGSRGEFTVAKDQNVRLRSGWFSDRSACYLAAGRPVVTQDTGFSEILPTGKELFGFTSKEEAVAAIDAINGDYHDHCRAAREIAEEYFSAEKVVRELARSVGLQGG